MQRNVTSALAVATLAIVLAACAGTPAPTAAPTPEPTPVVTPAPSPVPASPAASASAETAALVAYPSLAPGMSLPPVTTPSPVEPEPAISPAPSDAVDRQALPGREETKLCIHGWNEMWGGGPEIEGEMYAGTPVCRRGKETMGVDVAMRATYLESYQGDLQPVVWYIAAYWPFAANGVTVIIEKERNAAGDMGARATRRLGPGGSAIVTVEDQTFKIWEGGHRPDQTINGPHVYVEMCVFDVCSK